MQGFSTALEIMSAAPQTSSCIFPCRDHPFDDAHHAPLINV